MARGVNHHFLHLVQADRDTYRNWSLLAAILAVLLFAPAYFLYPWVGVAGYALAAGSGVAIGVAIAAKRVSAKEHAISMDWNGWMAACEGKESIGGVWRAMKGKSSRNQVILAAMAGATFWTLQVILVLLAMSNPSAVQVIPFIVVNGIIAGLPLGALLRTHRWLKQFAVSLEEMVESGEIGVWGVR